MEISPGAIGAGATVCSLVGGVLVRWISGSVDGVRATQKILFEKLDDQAKAVQEYKLHVAETYVNRDVLREQLVPIHETLKEIKEELREERNK